MSKKKKKKKVNPARYKLRSSGVANKEKFLRGCMAFVGLLFLIIFISMIYNFFFSATP